MPDRFADQPFVTRQARWLGALGQEDPRDVRHRADTPDVLPTPFPQNFLDWLRAPMFGIPTWGVLLGGVVAYSVLFGGRGRRR